MNRRLLFIIVSSCTIACKQKENWVQPVYAPITEALFASGHIEPVDQFVLTSSVEGYLRQSGVKEADVVEAGQLLFSLDHENRILEEQSSRENLNIARKNASRQSPVLLKLQADLSSAKEKFTRDSLQYSRLTLLYQSRSVAQVDVDNSRMQYNTDLANVESISENIKATQLSLQQALLQAEAEYNNASLGNKYYSFHSRQRSRIYQVFKKEGELVRKGETLALLGDPDSLLIILMVDEAGVSKVRAGQTVLVELNTAKGITLKGRVTKIYPYFDSSTQSFKVEAMFDQKVDNLIGGTLLQANIIVSSKEKAMLIPRSCLGPDGTVSVKRRGEIEKVNIKAGIVSTEWVEVLEGLSLSDQVLNMF